MTTGNRMKARRKEIGVPVDEVAAALGVSIATVYRYENGDIEKVPGAVLEPLAKVLKTTPNYLMGWDEPEKPPLPPNAYPYEPTHRIPILGRISAGLPLYAEENIEGYTYTELNSGGEYFALRVVGDSMDLARIYEGDLIIVRRQDVVEEGEIAVVLVGDDEATVKRFYQTETVVTLIPESTNARHKPQVYDLRYTSIRILGKVVRVEFNIH